jgi:hypothetical protein
VAVGTGGIIGALFIWAERLLNDTQLLTLLVTVKVSDVLAIRPVSTVELPVPGVEIAPGLVVIVHA